MCIRDSLPLVEEGKFWIYKTHFQSDMPSGISGHAITFQGDTIINSLSYKKVYRLELKGDHNCPPHERPCWDPHYPYQAESRALHSFIREDLMERKVYHLPLSDNNSCSPDEHLLIDFSLEVGDTLNDCIYDVIWTPNDPNIGVVDSIKIQNAYDKDRNTLFTYGFHFSIGLPFPLSLIHI